MSTVTSVDEIKAGSASHSWLPIYSALEVILVYAGIVTYIWRWRPTYPHFWMVLLGVVLASHFLHRDTFRTSWPLICRNAGQRPGRIAHRPRLLHSSSRIRFCAACPDVCASEPARRCFTAGYGIWCAFQQYLAQSYFHNRLMEVVRNRHLSSLLVGIIFGSAHIPNPILMVATTVAGFVFAEVFARHRNIWPIALAQAVGGLLIAAVSPASLIHNMRVGPGYLFYGLR